MIVLNVAIGVLIALAAIVAVLGVAAWLQARRREAWQRAALELGLAWSRDGAALVERCAGFKLFEKGRHRKATNLLEGELWGGPAALADYRYTTGSGKNSKVHRQTICVLRDAKLNLPAFVLRREGLGDRLAQAVLGAADIDFPDDPSFSRAWVLSGEDEESVRTLFAPELRLSLAGAAALPAYVEGRGDTVLFHGGRSIRPDAARELVQQAESVMAMVRSFARAD